MLGDDGNLVTDEFGNIYMVEYRVESWVGNYGWGNMIGGESGIYTRIVVYDKDGNPSQLPGFSPYKNNPLQSNLTFQSIILDELPMKTYVYNRNNPDEPLLEYDTRDHALNGDDYWPFCARKTDETIPKEELIYKVEYEVSDERLRKKFFDAAEDNENWDVTLDGNKIIIEWEPLKNE
jgi:hypothetical protein